MADRFWESEEVMSEKEADAILSSANEISEIEEESIVEEEIQEESAEESFRESEEEQEAEDFQVLKDASLRLEQGNLYKMLLKHNLFEGVEADTRAIHNVQREIRSFIRERLEVLVGLKEDPKLKKQQPITRGLPSGIFDETEIAVLKELLSKAVKKNPNSIAPIKQEKQLKINPLKHATSKPSGIVKVTNTTKAKAVKSALAKTEPVEQPRKSLTKHPSKMTVEELMEYNSQVKNRRADSPKKLPMPGDREMYMQYAARVNPDPSQTLAGVILGQMGKRLGLAEVVENDGGGYDGDSRI